MTFAPQQQQDGEALAPSDKAHAQGTHGYEPNRFEQKEDRLRLLASLGVDLTGLDLPIRAALEALAEEVLALRTDYAVLAKHLEQVEHLADRDTLCPVFNRRAFERELTREIALAARYGTPLCLVFVDLDRFKLVNDRFGHATGDTVLKEVAELLLGAVRQTDIIGRLGGDEFGIALTHADLPIAEMKADQFTALIDGLTIRDQADSTLEPVQLGASCGTVEWHPKMSTETLIAQADETMFRIKAKRRAAR